MKKWIKYLISTIIFSILYIVSMYLLTNNFNWKMIITVTALYLVIYAATDLICENI